jgi:hypothetical protein
MRSIKEIIPDIEDRVMIIEGRPNPYFARLTGQIFALSADGAQELRLSNNGAGNGFSERDEFARDRGLGEQDQVNEGLMALRVVHIGGIFQEDWPTILIGIDDQLFI